MTKAGWRCLDRWHYETEGIAEPKPTPSADEESRIAIMADRHWIAGARFGYGCGQMDDRKALDEAIEGRQELIRAELKPQPDSSSIPDRPSLSEAEILSSLYKYLRPEQVKPLIYSRTKDGIDCDYVTVELTQLANAIISRAFAAKESK